ncbi:hypothetical protein F444_14783 [Phytophthora nicotianae P1976]|uniref:DNA-directed RNA polymerase n=1 Tax=Phytophthora nicotianae P1976 TaxID=1317066 RepID=A0A080ZP03_PHYNI|nr:hypothetical protein F444_14783 [Phytophthora nicotianae P1976]
MIHRMLLVHLGYSTLPTETPTRTSASTMPKLKRQFMKKFKNSSFMDVNLHALFKSAIKAEDFEKALMNAIVSGDKTLTVNKMTFKNRLSSQQLHHKNKLNVLTTFRSIDTLNKGNSAKSSERAITLRQVHPTGTGYMCGITSADTGVKVGMSKQLSVSADITSASSSEVLKHIVLEDKQLIKTEAILQDMTLVNKHNLHKVFVNGDWLGCVHDFALFLTIYRKKRRSGEIHLYTTVSHNIAANEIHMWVDSGRLVRPLLVVSNNMAKKGYTHDTFRQWISLTNDHIAQLQARKIDIDDLARQGIVEYISPEEHENTYIAFEHDRFKQHITDPLHRFYFLRKSGSYRSNPIRIMGNSKRLATHCSWWPCYFSIHKWWIRINTIPS